METTPANLQSDWLVPSNQTVGLKMVDSSRFRHAEHFFQWSPR